MTDSPVLTLPNGNLAKILTAGSDTGQQLTVIDYTDFTCGNPPPFTRHDFVETFTVLSGRLVFQYQDEEPFLVTPGSTVTVADGRAHTFWNPDNQPLHLLLACTPAGLDNFFQDLHHESEKLLGGEIDNDTMLANIDRIRETHGIEKTAPAPNIE